MTSLSEISFVGSLHNQIMQALTQLGEFPNLSNLEIYSTAKEHVDSYYLENNLGEPQVIAFGEYQEHVDIILNITNVETYLISLEAEGKINTEQLQYLIQINSCYQNATDPNVLSNQLFDIQQNVSNSETLDIGQKALVYGASIIGANSGYYWFSAYNDPADPWYPNESADPKKKKPKWWERGLRDLLGFVVGFYVMFGMTGDPKVGTASGTVVGGGCSAAG
jgi:hypothetical protein